MISEEGGATRGKGYNPVRGAKVFEETHKLLDEFFPLYGVSYSEVTSFAVRDGKMFAGVEGKAITSEVYVLRGGYGLLAPLGLVSSPSLA